MLPVRHINKFNVTWLFILCQQENQKKSSAETLLSSYALVPVL